MRLRLEDMGIDPQRILMEEHSTDTYENIKNSLALCAEDASIVIVTCGYHIFRAQALAKKREGKTVALKAKAGQGGRLFGSVTAKDIAEGLSKLVGEPVDKRKVVLDTDIKSFGTYEVELRVYPQVVAKLKVKVEE